MRLWYQCVEFSNNKIEGESTKIVRIIFWRRRCETRIRNSSHYPGSWQLLTQPDRRVTNFWAHNPLAMQMLNSLCWDGYCWRKNWWKTMEGSNICKEPKKLSVSDITWRHRSRRFNWKTPIWSRNIQGSNRLKWKWVLRDNIAMETWRV